MEVIPVFDYADYSESLVLEDSPYRLGFSWNTRGAYWSLTVSDSGGDILLDGLKLVLGYELISEYADAGLPNGALLAVDPTKTLSRIGRGDLGNKASLVYVTAEELEKIKAAA